MIQATEVFKKNIESVEKLIHFDREVLDIAINGIEKLRDTLVEKRGIDYAPINGTNLIELLRNIRNNDSVKAKYSTINNQAIVLLVSYFGSAVADLFRDAAKTALESRRKSVVESEFKFKVSEILEFSESPLENIGDLLISKVGISFQDMKSISRVFKSYFDIVIEKDVNVNNIILGHACRHTIAHEAAIINKRVLNQVSGARPRTIKQELNLNEIVNFSTEEISALSNSMLLYVENLEKMVVKYKNGL